MPALRAGSLSWAAMKHSLGISNLNWENLVLTSSDSTKFNEAVDFCISVGRRPYRSILAEPT